MTNTEKTVRTTNKTALQYAIKNLPDAPAEIREKWEKMVEQLDKKNAAPRKMTKTQVENAAIRETVVEFLRENAPAGYTCGDLIKAVPALEGRSNQYVSALMKIAVDTDKTVEKYTDKRKTYFKAI
jgi:hypothetical protein